MRGAFRQADREALITLGLYVFFFVWWTAFAFGLGSGDPEEYSYVFGLPAWFFYSCVLGYPVMTLVLWIVVRRFFVEIPLEEDKGEKNNGKEGA
ncbi:YhdT family protein [Mailhella sp.]|uniref:YhdT family protein n=1 Tax=Mailhella sp. TaxID=1981029 RepID=UPI003AB56DA1